MHANNNKNNILVLGEGLKDGLSDASIKAEDKYYLNVSDKSRENTASSFLYAKDVKIQRL